MSQDVADYVYSMGARASAGSEVVMDCPFCGKTGRLYVNVEPGEDNMGKEKPAGRWICFSCGKFSNWLSVLMAELENIPVHDARAIIGKWKMGGIKFKRPVKPVEVKVKDPAAPWLPPEFESVRDVWPKYLARRDIKREIAEQFNLGVCRSGEFAHRIILPIECPIGRSFQARAIPKDLEPRYLSGDDSGQMLFGWHSIAESSVAVLVEGPFDALKVVQAGLPAVAMMGKQLRDTQYDMLRKRRRSYVVMLDPIEKDPQAIDNAISIAEKLGGKVATKLEDDPGASECEDIMRAYQLALEPRQAWRAAQTIRNRQLGTHGKKDSIEPG